jgi:hypothetical protein
LLVQAILIVAMAGVVQAGTQGSDCAGDASKILLYENSIGDTSDNDDRFWRCSNTSDLNDFAHTLPGNCKSIGLDSSTWNDCVSSYKVWVPDGFHLTIYNNADWGSWSHCFAGPWNGGRVNAFSNDAISSFRWLSGESCP